MQGGLVVGEDIGDPRRVDVAGVSLRCVDVGAGTPAYLLLHAGGASLEGWRAVLPALARGARVVAIDRPGWGGSGRPPQGLDGVSRPSPYGPVGEAAIVAALVEQLRLGQPIVVGSSAGGTVALVAALERAELFTGLVLLSPGVYSGLGRGLAPGWLVPLMRTRAGRRLGARLTGQGFAKSFPAEMRKMFHDATRVTPDWLSARAKEIGVDSLGPTLWETAIAARPIDFGRRLATCQLPALVIAGSSDRYVPPAENARLAQALPRARLELVADCGHLPHEEHPETFTRLVRGFRDEIAGR